MEESAIAAAQLHGGSANSLQSSHLYLYVTALAALVLVSALVFFWRRTPRADLHTLDVGLESRRYRRNYFIWWVAMPAVVFASVFGSICAVECTVAPWYTFLVAPVVILVLGLVVAIFVWMRVGEFPDPERKSLRSLILWSILWGPALGYAGFGAALIAIQPIALLVSWIVTTLGGA